MELFIKDSSSHGAFVKACDILILSKLFSWGMMVSDGFLSSRYLIMPKHAQKAFQNKGRDVHLKKILIFPRTRKYDTLFFYKI